MITQDVPDSNKFSLITILGPTACGKTKLAVNLAAKVNGEIISADSRQVYRAMDIGTGKDLSEYNLRGLDVPYHLIDIADAGYKYNVFEYQKDFIESYNDIIIRNKQPILCGGTGLYLESVLRNYDLAPVPENPELRKELEKKPLNELEEILTKFRQPHNKTDFDTVKRAVRAIEIEVFYQNNPERRRNFPKIDSIVFGLDLEREERRRRITMRLKARINEGMIEEVSGILKSGVSTEDLIYYGLEYKYVTMYITGQLTFDEMFNQLEIAIHQFAKRQMTWFRGMEKRGVKINWLNAMDDPENNVEKILNLVC
jgi:tRNA dimethylallyltransferase